MRSMPRAGAPKRAIRGITSTAWMAYHATVGKGRFELPTSRSRTAHSNLAELLPDARPG
jgi:transposase